MKDKKFYYKKANQGELSLPSHILIKSQRTLDFCKKQFNLPDLKIQWIKQTDHPDDAPARDQPLAGFAKSPREILVNGGEGIEQIPDTIAHEAFHVFLMKHGIPIDKDVSELAAESVAKNILREIKILYKEK